jgi:hypothetical protein
MWSRRLTTDQQASLLEAYARGDHVIDIAQRFKVHHSYPTLLARRRGIPTRRRMENQRYAGETADEEARRE